jgi:Ca-activated chloride channel family protein
LTRRASERELHRASPGDEEVVVKALVFGSTFALVFTIAVTAQQPVPQLPAAAPPPQAAEPQSHTVFRSGASLVALNVTVTDGKRYVDGLQRGDFTVYEDGVQQHVEFFEAQSVPIDLIVLIDTSSSMTDKMDTVHQAALGFLKTLRPKDRGAVVAFSDGVEILQPLTSDIDALQTAINATHAHGATALHNALYVALKQFGRAAQQAGEVRRQAIAVLSDGADTSSVVSFDDVLAVARKSGVGIYTIALESEYGTADPRQKYFSTAMYSMRTLAQETGAQSYFPSTVKDLRGIYAGISAELSSQYSIGYTPSNGRPDGRFRRVVIQVPSRPDLRPRARPGYTADTVHVAENPPSGQR